MFFSRTPRKQQTLSALPGLADASRRQLDFAAANLDIVTVPAGTVLLTEGQMGHEFYLVLEGWAEASRDGELLGSLRPGDVIGEMHLLEGGRRSATVMATTDMTLATATRRELRALMAEIPGLADQVTTAAAARAA